MSEAHRSLIDYWSKKTELTSSQKSLILDLYEHRYLKKKEFLFKSGEVCDVEAFIVSGTVRIFYLDQKGLEHVLYFGFKNWWAGDIASFSEREPALLNAQALEDTEILTINPENKDKLLTEIPALERVFREITQRHLTVLQKRFLLTVSANANERYLELLERSPGIEQLVPQHQIASYLGILPESLSRMKKQMLR